MTKDFQGEMKMTRNGISFMHKRQVIGRHIICPLLSTGPLLLKVGTCSFLEGNARSQIIGRICLKMLSAPVTILAEGAHQMARVGVLSLVLVLVSKFCKIAQSLQFKPSIVLTDV